MEVRNVYFNKLGVLTPPLARLPKEPLDRYVPMHMDISSYLYTYISIYIQIYTHYVQVTHPSRGALTGIRDSQAGHANRVWPNHPKPPMPNPGCLLESLGCGSKQTKYLKLSPGKWKPGLKPAVWWFNFLGPPVERLEYGVF